MLPSGSLVGWMPPQTIGVFGKRARILSVTWVAIGSRLDMKPSPIRSAPFSLMMPSASSISSSLGMSRRLWTQSRRKMMWVSKPSRCKAAET